MPTHSLQIIKPIFALGVLMEAANLAFLPSYLESVFADSDWSISSAYGVFYACIVGVLLPAGGWAKKHSLKTLIWISVPLT